MKVSTILISSMLLVASNSHAQTEKNECAPDSSKCCKTTTIKEEKNTDKKAKRVHKNKSEPVKDHCPACGRG